MEIRLQPLPVTAELGKPSFLCIASYENGSGEELSFELAPIVYDEAGFDINSPVFGKEYKRPKDTARETAGKALEGPGPVMGPAHSFITAENPFMRRREGTAITDAETVHTHQIIIGAVEAAKRYKAQCGEVPEGFVNSLRVKPKYENSRNADRTR
jgi:hypothetical protein